MASALTGSCARRSNFISVIVGSAASNSMTRFPIILRSRLIATAGFAIATSCARYSRRWSVPAWMQGLSGERALRSMQASSKPMPAVIMARLDIDWSAPERQTRAVAEFLTAFDEEGADAERKPPKVISPVDPCSAWTAKANKRVQFGYGLNYLIDIKYAVIVDVEATPARTYDEVAATKTMIQRTQERLGLKPDWLAADTAYGTGKFLHWVIGAGITPHIPVWDMSKREEGILSRADFIYARERNLYVCPQGKFLRTTGTVHDGRTIVYRASTRDCSPCALKLKCTPNMT